MKSFRRLRLLLIFAAAPLSALDWGVTGTFTAQDAYSPLASLSEKTADGSGLVTLTGRIIPWISARINKHLSVEAAVALMAERTGDTWTRPLPLPEPGLTQAVYAFDSGAAVRLGRISYTDASGLAASGLFDGLSCFLPFGSHSLDFGAYWTGFLYKKSAKITMNANDRSLWYNADRYFAPARALANLRYSAVIGASALGAEILAQIDTSAQNALHSQYLNVFWRMDLPWTLKISAAASGELMESSGGGNTAAVFGYAADFALSAFTLHTLSLRFRFASGDRRAGTGYSPVTGVEQGMVFTPKLSGLGFAGLDYKSGWSGVLGLAGFLRYFFDVSGGLGPELYLSCVYAPWEDLQFAAGAGVFFPSGGSMLWNVSAGVVIAF